MKDVPGQISIFDFLEPANKQIHGSEVGIGALHRYLRYGPHTLVYEARNSCKEYLELNNGEVPASFIKLYGNPKSWTGFACQNCKYGRNSVCSASGVTYHREFGILICDGFRQTIDGKIPDKPICKYSNHSCNKENLWEVAEMDGGQCKRVCCRQCDVVGCGARCNGSEVIP